MRTTNLRILLLFLIVFLGLTGIIQTAHAETPVVRAVLFYSPTCPACHNVISEHLPPLIEKYGNQLLIVGVDVSQPGGQNLYQAMVTNYGLSEDRIGVPTLVVGDTILVGSGEIPDMFPGIIEQGLNSGGISWPKIPGLKEALAESMPPEEAAQIEEQFPVDEDLTFVDRFSLDPFGNSIAVIVLIGMLACAVSVGYLFLKGGSSKKLQWPQWVIPTLALIGLVAALYLSYVEITKSEALCGPVGDCNRVQESPYAYLFGVISVGILGVVGYLALLAAWAIQRFGPSHFFKPTAIAIWGLSWFGLLFSIYLTFLEPFVIGATCAWCITSAIVMTMLLWASTSPALSALQSEDDAEFDSDEEHLDESEITPTKEIDSQHA